ncbi:carboxypeptidase B-like [Oppia nitens]|uniref:carboxypeptidase B-like n=1 Tax=Oppia nitens TaxID=1686743 RepID=UPI0023D9EABF|nr:carboxypeptidase B-like [Oppia nitens]
MDDNNFESQYKGFKVLRLLPNTVDQLQYLSDISTDLSLVIPNKKIDFWTQPKDVNSSVDVMVSPDIYIDIFEQEKRTNDDQLMGYRTKSWAQNSSSFFEAYHSITEIYQFLEDLHSIDTELSSIETIGTTTENRPMKLFKIGTKSKDNSQKPIIWIDAGIHAREWIAPSTALYIAHKLITSSDSDVKHMLDVYDYYIMPSANPDGYEYSRLSDRMWRKTRSHNPSFWGLFCRGVDPNRNYGYHWGSAGSSSYPCSETYHGKAPFSEPETKAISDYILTKKDNIKMYIAMHSYSQFILTPWGWTSELPKQYNDMVSMGQKAAQTLQQRYGTHYKVGSSTRILYAASGGADDWAHGTANIKYSYTFELRDTGVYGFILPVRYIIPTGEETFDAIKTMSYEIKDEYKLKAINT